MRLVPVIVPVIIVAFAVGCSALVSPDEARLGGGPDGATDGATADAFDTGPIDVDDAGPDARDGSGGCPAGCDDAVDCTTDVCIDGACVSMPGDDACADGLICDAVLGCTTPSCRNDRECDDGAYCNGEERCEADDPSADARGCVAGDAVECDDGAACTADACDEDADACTATPDDGACGDGIDCTVDRCSPSTGRADERGCTHEEDDGLCMSADFCTVGLECDGAAGGCSGGTPRDCRDGDLCTVDSCDSSAGTCVNVGRDEDGDGYDATRIGGTTCATGMDCDDDDPLVNPGATELCNGRDDDCDGLVDESCTPIPDTCASAEAIAVTVGAGPTTVTGRLGDYSANYGTQCGASGGRDAVYYVDVTSPVDLTIDTLGSAADTVLSVATTCSAAGFRALGCDDDIDRGVVRESRVWVHRFGPRPGEPRARLFILVDGYNASATGNFTLNVSATPATADTCAMPIDISGGGSLVGFIAPSVVGVLGPTGSCQSFGDATLTEAVAQVTGPMDGNASFSVYSDFFDPDLYLRSAPCATGSEVACVAGDGTGAAGFTYQTTLATSVTAGDDYYLFVDGVGGSAAYFVSFEP